MIRTTVLTLIALLLPACGSSDGGEDASPGNTIDIGLVPGYTARLLTDGLNNPSCVAVSPGGLVAVCDSGNGRILRIADDGSASVFIDGFTTEYWKPDIPRFKVGPLSMVWLDDTRFAVTNAGLPDGAEQVLLFDRPGVASDGIATNPIPPTTGDPADRGEGNLTGLSRSADGQTLYLCGHGSDARTWLLSCDVAAHQMRTFVSADAANIQTNSPMDTLVMPHGSVLVLYSGKGGVEDSLLVEWDVAGRTPRNIWSLPGLTDAYAMAFVPGTWGPNRLGELVIVDHAFDPTTVRPGKIARVGLTLQTRTDGPSPHPAQVTIIASNVLGPTGCEFGRDGRLFVTLLGDEPDSDRGQLVAIDGFAKKPAQSASP